MEIRVRRVKRADLDGLCELLDTAGLPVPLRDRAGLRRFRNIVGDLAVDFDVARQSERVTGFVHLSYTRDLLHGNRARMLALVGTSATTVATLFDAAQRRARARRCADITASAGPWLPSPESFTASGWLIAAGSFCVDLAPKRAQSGVV